MFSTAVNSVNNVNAPPSSAESADNVNKDLPYRPSGMFGFGRGAKSRNGR